MKKSLFTAVLLTCSFLLYSQQQEVRIQKLNTENSSWTSVISGKALCPPEKTSYGFAVLTDGKMISACTDAGKKLWEKGIPGRPDPFITVFSSDFLLTVSDKSNLTLTNPSGLSLWTVKVPFPITQKPFVGRDSRIFVKGKKHIACYGVNGICKWKLDTAVLRDSQLMELNDGTIMALLESTSGGKTGAIRFSPFGEILENITFTGIVQSAAECSDGILLSFNGGGAGMCAVKDNQTLTKWTIPYSDRAFSNTNPAAGSRFHEISNHRAVLLVGGSGAVKTRVLVFSTFDGRVSDWFNVDCSYKDIVCSSITSDSENLFVCDSRQAFVHSTNGDIQWNCLLPVSPDLFSKWNFISFTRGNYLVICSTSWAMAGFRTAYRLAKKSTQKKAKKNYRDFYSIDSSFIDFMGLNDKIDEKYRGNNRASQLLAGNYGTKEIEFTSAVLSFCKGYAGDLAQSHSGARVQQKSIYQRDQTGVQDILIQLSLFGTDDFVPYVAGFIKMENDDTNFLSILKSVSNFGYDPDSYILNAIDVRIRKIPSSRTTEFYLVCDAVYEICRFMGRPALYSHGMEILTQLLYPQYDSSVRDYARNTLTKIAVLKI